jgi:hypothetical protein
MEKCASQDEGGEKDIDVTFSSLTEIGISPLS